MNSRILAALLVAGCVGAATAGAYVAVRQNSAAARPATAVPAAPAQVQPVSETEAIVGSAPATPSSTQPVQPSAPEPRAESPKSPGPAPRPEPPHVATASRNTTSAARPSGTRSASPMAPPVRRADRGTIDTPAVLPAVVPVPEPVRPAEPPPAPREPEFEEVVLPTSSVIGLQVDTPLSTERARVEDRVDARVTRDVTAAGRVAIPAGSRVIGSVTLVERGGKMKDPARLGVRFHTLVLADGREMPLRTEAIFREGDSPGNESARKVGGAAIGGAILGAIIGGGKGAMVGGAAGAAGGSAAVMAGGRNAATLPAGTVVTVRLSAPATIEVGRDPQ